MASSKELGFNLGVQQLRGIAALVVMLCHYGSDMKNYPIISKILNKGQLGVHIFFLISGYIIVHTLVKNNYHPRKFFAFLVKRMIRIDPPYFVVILLTLLTFFVLSQISSFHGQSIPFIPGQFFAHIFYIVPFTNYEFYTHIFWTLAVEFQFYLVIGIFYFLTKKHWFKYLFLICFTFTSFIPFPNTYYLLSTYAPIFSAGMALIAFTISKKWPYLLIMILDLALICYRFDFLTCLLLVIAIIFIVCVNKSFDYLSFLGKTSYSIYLIHPLVLIYVLGIGKTLGVGNIDELFYLLIKVSIGLISAYCFYLLVEKPAITFSKKLTYRDVNS